MSDIKYPDVVVRLSDSAGNVFSILGKVSAALRKANVSKEDRDAFVAEATQGDYNELLRVCMQWVDVH